MGNSEKNINDIVDIVKKSKICPREKGDQNRKKLHDNFPKLARTTTYNSRSLKDPNQKK